MAEEAKKPKTNIREDLVLLESNIDKLKVKYEQYFMNVIKREPLGLKGHVDRMVTFYTHQYIPNTSNNFKFRNLADKYNSYKQYWVRTLKEISEGAYKRRSENSGVDMKVLHSKSKSEKNESIRDMLNADDDFFDAQEDETEIRTVYETYINEMKKINEPTENITFNFMKRTVDAHRKKAEEKYGTDDLDVKITSADGKVTLQITPKGEEGQEGQE
jgi:hypothetical protein